MKVGLVCPYNMFKGGGVQEVVLALQMELTKRGHEAYIITPQPRVVPAEKPEHMLFIGGAADVKTPMHTTAQISFSANNEALEEVLRSHDFDLLHFHEPWIPVMSWQLLAKSKARNLATFHAKLPDTFMSKTIEKAFIPYTKSILRYLHGFTAVSDAAAAYISDLTDKPITIVPNGIDLAKYAAADVSTQPNTILYIGRLEKRKGIKYLLCAFAELQKRCPDARLVIGGDGPDREKLEKLSQRLKLKHVEFLGYVDESKKLQLFREARVFCAPAIYGESFGIVLLEAMAMNVPVVAGNNPGYIGVMQDRGSISIVDPKDAEAFASRLELLLTDEHLRELWQSWAKAYITQFDYAKVADQYVAVYENVLKSS